MYIDQHFHEVIHILYNYVIIITFLLILLLISTLAITSTLFRVSFTR